MGAGQRDYGDGDRGEGERGGSRRGKGRWSRKDGGWGIDPRKVRRRNKIRGKGEVFLCPRTCVRKFHL